jgi:cystathionine gamma-synthase
LSVDLTPCTLPEQPSNPMNIETLAVHAGDLHDDQFGTVAQPIYPSTTFARKTDGTFREHLYSRYSTPNRSSFEEAIALLESGTSACAFSSGLSSAMAILQTLPRGSTVLFPDDVYHGVTVQFSEIFEPLGMNSVRIDFSDLAIVEEAILKYRPSLVWMESPSNPLLKITDIESVCTIAKSVGALTLCDNTWATPLLQRPLELNCDIVLHSATKYIGGHSDILMGVLVTNDETLIEKLRTIQRVGGAVPSAFDCWLAHRGIKSLAVRVKAQCESALIIAKFLESHPAVEQVLYPGLPSHPQYSIAQKQMKHPGAMMSILVNGNAMNVANSTKIFTHATSLGGVESLIEHRASVETGTHSVSPDNLLRLSIGLEHPDDLCADLAQALSAVNS